jgi:hypothetical protein
MKPTEKARRTADEKFKAQEKRRSEASQAMNEYVAAQRAVDANTARLRALRLARDAAASAPPAAPATPKKRRPPAAKPAR